MDEGVHESGDGHENLAPRRRSRRRAVLAAGFAVAAVVVGVVWSQRDDIADRAISSVLREKGIPAHWRVAAIGLREQVITDVVIGNPAHPDLTIDRLVTTTALSSGAPALRTVTLVNPRLRGSWRGGKLSFGSLDRLLSGPSTGPFRLPDLVLRVENGRGAITGDAGVIALGLVGAGPLRAGFAGSLVAVARRLDLPGCLLSDLKLSGHIGTADERLRLTGPLRLADAVCAGGIRAAALTMPLDLRATPGFDGGDGHVGWAARGLAFGAAQAATTQGAAELTLRQGALTARYAGRLQGVQAQALTAATLASEGMMHSDRGFAHVAVESTLGGSGLAPDAAAWRRLDQARAASANTLAGPLIARIAGVLAREAPGSRLTARYMLHGAGADASVVVPQAQWTGGSGAVLLTLSRGTMTSGSGTRRYSAHFTTGEPLPAISGVLAPGADGYDRLSLAMANYRAGPAELAIPGLAVTLAGGGATLAGEAVVSGPLPGGAAQKLHVPITGAWSQARGLSLWPRCTRLSFDRLALASLTLRQSGLTLCPGTGGAIVQSGAQGTSVAAGVPAFDLTGQLGGSPIRLTGGPLGLAMLPGQPVNLFGKAVLVTLGQGQGGTSRFRLDTLNARFGATVGGGFSGSTVELAAVPLDLRKLGGSWRYDRGALTVSDASFELADREQPARFQPLVAHGAALTLAKGAIEMTAVLREPRSDRAITRVAIRHDLASGTGHADLAVDGIRFDKLLQPEMLSTLMLGVVADARGTVTGKGAIDWAGGNVTSQGRFASDSLDLAAAFGPVKGVSGTVTFTDLLGLVTAPDQQLKIARINPGVEVDDGVLTFAMLPGHVLAVRGAEWPFLDGRLRLLPTRLTLGASEVRRYEMRVDGVDAAKFLVRMNMSNLNATGLFDGIVPLRFDDKGGSVVGGMLASRPPGGSLSYIGALSYKDLSPMANYAFETLKSLNYTQLSIGLDGSLSGDIFTRVSMRGVTQGSGARRNFLTRQIGKLPLQFNINIHAPFYMLMTNFRSMYDPSYLADPRTLGLLGADGKPVAKPAPAKLPAPAVQPPLTQVRP